MDSATGAGGGPEDETRHRFATLRARAAALAADFADVTRAYEAGELTSAEAIARHKVIAAEMRAVADEMRTLVPTSGDADAS